MNDSSNTMNDGSNAGSRKGSDKGSNEGSCSDVRTSTFVRTGTPVRTLVRTSGRTLARTTLVGAVLIIYGPDVGHGFIQDDFAWILHARGEDLLDVLARAFTTSLGFFRPIVTLSFTLNERMLGLQPFGYGLTNLLLAIGCMFGVERLGRRLGLAPGYAMVAAAVWVLNFHGINMSVLWISARTSLLATLFAVLAAHAFESRSRLLAGVWTMLAVLSKEEAVLLPFMLTGWRLLDLGREMSRLTALRRAVLESWWLFAALACYAVLRSQSGAFTPMTAPDFYRFTIDPAHLTRNVVEYLTRSAVTGAVVLVALIAVVRAKPRFDRMHAALVIKGVVWWMGGFAITMWLPVRSSLYAVFPSVGVALIVAALAAALVSSLSLSRRRTLAIAGLLLPFVLLPVYRARNVRWVSMADVSSMTVEHARAKLPGLPDGGLIALIDDRDVRANFTNTFGGLTPEASQLFLTRGIELAIDPPPASSRPRIEVRLRDLRRVER